MAKKQKTTTLRGYGSINTSNVNNERSECVTLTYAVFNVKNRAQQKELEKEMPELTDEHVSFDIGYKNHKEENEKIEFKAKVKTCENEPLAHKISDIFDKFIKKKGGQTALDAVMEEES